MNAQMLEESIELYKTGLPMLKVCSITGISFGPLQQNLQKRNLSRSNKQNSRKYQVNHNYFHTIDSEEKAYWLGFFYADGYVSRKTSPTIQKLIGCSLQESDCNHIEKLKHSLQATYPIGHYINNNSFGENIK